MAWMRGTSVARQYGSGARYFGCETIWLGCEVLRYRENMARVRSVSHAKQNHSGAKHKELCNNNVILPPADSREYPNNIKLGAYNVNLTLMGPREFPKHI